MHFIFSRTAIMYVKIWSRILSVVGQWVCLRVTNNASDMHSVGLSLRRFAKIIILGENLHFSFNNLFYCLFDDWNKDPCFFVSLYSWMFPNSFILVLLDFVWYCYHQSSAIYLSILIWSLYVTFGMFLVDVNRVEQGGRCFCLELLSALLFFIVLLNCPFSFFILSSFMFEN